MTKASGTISLITGVFLISGCAIINPYDSEFSCPETSSRGKCISVNSAYKEVTSSSTSNFTETKTDKPDEQKDGETRETQNYNHYRSALYDKFGKLLKEPKTPVVSPPKTMRVLLLPYTGQDNEFYMLRYVYFFVDDARWLLGDSVTSNDEEE